MDSHGPVLLFDGECGLCVRCVKLLLAVDRRRRLRFALLQGGAAQGFLRERGLPAGDFDSAIFVADWARRDGQPPVFKTDALLAALAAAGGVWRLATVLALVPRRWRDAGYDWVARRRRRLWGGGADTGWWRALDAGRFLE